MAGNTGLIRGAFAALLALLLPVTCLGQVDTGSPLVVNWSQIKFAVERHFEPARHSSFMHQPQRSSPAGTCDRVATNCRPLALAQSGADWNGLKSDTWYFVGAQLASLGVLYALPEDVSNWNEDQKDNFSLNKWRENVSNPRIDKDKFYLNYILHPYWGATYYVRARERGYDRLDSFWYSVFLSTFYEVGPEALFEQPSIQDLIVTPVFGAWLGHYFMDWRNAIRERSEARGFRTGSENWIWYLTDPLDLLNRGIDRALGRSARLDVRLVSATANIDSPLFMQPAIRYGAPENSRLFLSGRSDRLTGFEFSLSW